MAIIPEVVIQRAIIDGIRGIRKDPRILNALFKNLPVTQQEHIKTFIQDSIIDFNVNYPKTEIKVPAIVLLMKNEVESQEFLNDIAGAPPHYDMPDADMAVDVLGTGVTSTGSLGEHAKLVLGNLHVASQIPADATLPGSLSDVALTFTENDQDVINTVFSEKSTWPQLYVHVVAGPGAGQVRAISSITAQQLDITGSFSVNCTSSSVVEIRYAPDVEKPYGQPVRAYAVGNTGQLRIGANYDGQYQLEVLAGNQEEVIYLYTVLKAILFAQREFLEAQGIMALRLSGSDLAPRSELLPDECYTRTMTLQFTYPFDFIVETEVVKAIQIAFTNIGRTEDYPGATILIDEFAL